MPGDAGGQVMVQATPAAGGDALGAGGGASGVQSQPLAGKPLPASL